MRGQQAAALTTSNEVLWTNMAPSSFRAELRCEAPGGCLVSNEYKHPGAAVGHVPAAEAECVEVAYKETRVVHLWHAFLPTDGLSILAPVGGQPGSPTFSILQQMNGEPAGLLEFYAPALPGAVSAW